MTGVHTALNVEKGMSLPKEKLIQMDITSHRRDADTE